jgi:hypothetical protein
MNKKLHNLHNHCLKIVLTLKTQFENIFYDFFGDIL